MLHGIQCGSQKAREKGIKERRGFCEDKTGRNDNSDSAIWKYQYETVEGDRGNDKTDTLKKMTSS